MDTSYDLFFQDFKPHSNYNMQGVLSIHHTLEGVHVSLTDIRRWDAEHPLLSCSLQDEHSTSKKELGPKNAKWICPNTLTYQEIKCTHCQKGNNSLSNVIWSLSTSWGMFLMSFRTLKCGKLILKTLIYCPHGHHHRLDHVFELADM